MHLTKADAAASKGDLDTFRKLFDQVIAPSSLHQQLFLIFSIWPTPFVLERLFSYNS